LEELREQITKSGCKANKYTKALYTYQEDGDIKVMLATHVDDLMFACKEGYDWVVKKILDKFEVRETQTGKIRFCGREVVQDAEMNITVTCKDTAEKCLPISFQKEGRGPEDKATEGEISQLRSVVGSIAWIARQCRIELAYYTSRLQSCVSGARVKHLQEANKVLQMAINDSRRGLYYKANAFDWDKAILVTVTDASWAGEVKYINDEVFPKRSQKGRVTLLADPNAWSGNKADAYVLSWKSNMIKRVCRSTMAAETQSLLAGVAAGMKMRAVIADAMGRLEPFAWQASSAPVMKHVWMTDCESLNSYITNPVAAGNEDSRLELDLEDLRQILWEDHNGYPIDTLKDDDNDKVRWIDTSTMLADPLTKNMKPDRLLAFLESGILDLEPTAAAIMSKMMKQKQRKNVKEQKNLKNDD